MFNSRFLRYQEERANKERQSFNCSGGLLFFGWKFCCRSSVLVWLDSSGRADWGMTRRICRAVQHNTRCRKVAFVSYRTVMIHKTHSIGLAGLPTSCVCASRICGCTSDLALAVLTMRFCYRYAHIRSTKLRTTSGLPTNQRGEEGARPKLNSRRHDVGGNCL